MAIFILLMFFIIKCRKSEGRYMTTSIAPVGVNTPKFKSRADSPLKSVQRFPDYEVRTYETEGSTGKKWGVGIASALFPGLGQAINGQWGKAAGFFFGSIAASIAGEKIGGRGANIIATIAVTAWSIIDAVNNAKTTTTQVVPIQSQKVDVNA